MNNFYISVLLISQFNGLDIIIQRIDETLRRGLPTKADDKSATTDILESSIATLRILAKGKGLKLQKLSKMHFEAYF